MALLFGSTVQRTDTAASDIDLLLVSDDVTPEAVYAAMAPVEDMLGRRVNPLIYTSDEFRKRRTANTGFLTRILQGPHVILVGCLDGH